MSIDSNTPVESIPEYQEDLDLFSKDFFGQKEPAPDESANSEQEEEDEVENDRDANEEDVDSKTDAEDDEQEEVDEQPKPKKNRFQERIGELTKQAREAERQAQELAEKLKQYEETPKPEAKAVPTSTGPDPEDQNEDGTDKYPLGEFDPSYIRDLTKFTLAEERKLVQAEEAKVKEQAEAQEFKARLNEQWNEKLTPAQERYPDFHEKGENLNPVFESIDQRYGEYLAATIMEMDYGPDVLYYLASNVDEAEKIVRMGPTKATIALGKIEAKYSDFEEDKQKARPKLSKAPTPPAHLNKGSAPAKLEADDDTDDLDAFAKKFFAKRRRY